MTRRTRVLALLLMIAIAAPHAAAATGSAVPSSGVIDRDTTWKGEVRVEQPLTVAREATLTVAPGTSVHFTKGAGLIVQGKLVAEGTAEKPILFSSAEAAPAPGDWTGIDFSGSRDGSVLSRCVIRHAAAISVAHASPAVRDCEVEKGKTGLVLSLQAGPAVTGNSIREMTEGGINCGKESFPTIEKNAIRSCGPFGILSSQNAGPVVRENNISECERGLVLNGAVPPVERNTFRKNKIGLSASSVPQGLFVRENRFLENGTGILCAQFANPVIERNELTGNGEALVCNRSSRPLVRHNDISKNGTGISCTNLSSPRIAANNIGGNKKGIFLTFSSYAVVTGNNIDGNGIQMELGNMSSDWEEKVGKKPERGMQAQRSARITRGVAGPQEMAAEPGDGAVLMGAVDATGNWWGEKDTDEMEKKGPKADIKSLIDYYDVPTRTYEGYPGEYVQDRIRYEGWKTSRIEDAGAR